MDKYLKNIAIIMFFLYLVFYLNSGIAAVLNNRFGDIQINTLNGKLISIVYVLLALYFVVKQYSNYIRLFFAWTIYICFSYALYADNITGWFFESFQQALWCIIFLFFYTFRDNDKYFPNKVILFCVIIAFLYGLFLIYQQIIYTRSYNFTKFLQIKEVYYIVLFLPWIYMVRNFTIKSILIILGIMLIIFSLKRTAMVSTAISLSIYYLILAYQKRKIKLILYILPIAFVVYFAVQRVNNMYEGRLFERLSSIVEDRGTGRLDIYAAIIERISNSSFFEIFFGIGYDGIHKATNNYSAHNEYLEIIGRWGLVGLVLYIIILCSIFFKAKQMNKKNYKYFPMFVMSIAIFLTMSMTTHIVIYPHLFAIIISFWGYIIADFEKNT